MGEMIGALGTAFKAHKIFTVPARGLFRKADGMIGGTVEEGLRNFGAFLEDLNFLPFIPPGLLTDRSLDDIDFYLRNAKNVDGSPIEGGKYLPTSFRTSAKLVPFRKHLRDVKAQIAVKYPEAKALLEEVFERELRAEYEDEELLKALNE